MSRKHFQDLAETLAGAGLDQQSMDRLLPEIIRFCKRQNSNFDSGRFIEAVEKAGGGK